MTIDLRVLAAIFSGGFMGTTARYGVSLLMSSAGWPWATFIVNLTGAFLLGWLLESLVLAGPDQGGRRLIRLGFGTGLLGSYTTYSALAVEALGLSWGLGSGYVVASVVGGICLAALGVSTARWSRS